MSFDVRYGSAATMQFAGLVDADARVDRFAGPPPEQCVAAFAAVQTALAAPLDLPPLSRAVVPGDRITLALQGDIPSLPQIVSATVQTLLAAGIEAGDITCLQPPSAGKALDPRRGLDAHLAAKTNFLVHDPLDRGQLSYLGANSAGEPIYLNRAIADADLVLPLHVLHPRSWSEVDSPLAGLFPGCSDPAAQKRFHALREEDDPQTIERRRAAETDEVGWMLGVQYALSIVPGGNEQVLAAWCGPPAATQARAREQFDRVWTAPAAPRAPLVVAAVTGGEGRQSWENLGRALAAAAECGARDGSILVLCELSAKPGAAVHALAGADDPWQAVQRMSRHAPDDLQTALQILRAQDSAKIFLYSKLPAELTEELGFVHVANRAEAQRLVAHAERLLVLENAQDVQCAPRDA